MHNESSYAIGCLQNSYFTTFFVQKYCTTLRYPDFHFSMITEKKTTEYLLVCRLSNLSYHLLSLGKKTFYEPHFSWISYLFRWDNFRSICTSQCTSSHFTIKIVLCDFESERILTRFDSLLLNRQFYYSDSYFDS